VFRDVALDELQQHVGHVLALGGGGRLEAVVEFAGDVQVHALCPLFFWLGRLPHPLSGVRIYGYE